MKKQEAIETVQVFDLAAGINSISQEEFEDVKKAHRVLLELIKQYEKDIEDMINYEYVCEVIEDEFNMTRSEVDYLFGEGELLEDEE